ncbi:hypothetical protein [Candidatus Accumulibacter phosphatis]|uniref:Uncharacterized protein n=2 Tax=Candidatus Accumulibacter TaxID=327159 RepID=A0A7D5SB66_9PROT|nr:hypothetical protein [Candidatus Accumulibacter phosphatis]QLH49437.1 MAG: hypothetical protein HWD57_06325 [Candidatus Accumulibacter cognatus]TMQ77912.1 hypothetical protein ACCUM_2512 [Candidatus Accumulibacter phosphatis]
MALSAELETLHASLSCCTYRGDQHTHVLIEEPDRHAILKKVTIKAPIDDWFSFDPDKGRGKQAMMSPLLATGKAHDHHRACDCVLLIRREGVLAALYIDLKSGNPSGYSGQFKSTRQFVRYALGLLAEFHGQSLALAEERYVLLYGGKPPLINKTPTVPKTKTIGKTQPDKPYKREVSNPCSLYLKELLA